MRKRIGCCVGVGECKSWIEKLVLYTCKEGKNHDGLFGENRLVALARVWSSFLYSSPDILPLGLIIKLPGLCFMIALMTSKPYNCFHNVPLGSQHRSDLSSVNTAKHGRFASVSTFLGSPSSLIASIKVALMNMR